MRNISEQNRLDPLKKESDLLIMDYKKIIKNIQSHFSLANRILVALNKKPELIFGKKYAAYKKHILAHYDHYDNTADLLKMANHALTTVPFYRKNAGVDQIKSVADFKKHFPLIDKTMVNLQMEDFVSSGVDRKAYDLMTTGGTSGFPLKLYLPRTRYVLEITNKHVMWNKVFGYNYDLMASLKNAHVPKYQINPIAKELVFDGFRLSDDYFEYVYATMKKYKTKQLLCYPSSGYEFAKFLHRRQKDYSFLTTIIASSENVYDYQKEFIEKTLGLRFFTWYGHTEKLVFAGYCAHSDLFHVESNYGFCELLDEDGNEVTVKGQMGEIVGTTLHNEGMPLMRYRTGDYAEYYGEECPHCGRKVKLFRKIMGRWDGDKIYKGDGSFVTSTALNLHDDLYTVIDGLQYYQEKAGELTVRIIPNAKFNRDYEERILNHYIAIMPGDKIIIDKVEHLERLLNGKFMLLISNIGKQV